MADQILHKIKQAELELLSLLKNQDGLSKQIDVIDKRICSKKVELFNLREELSEYEAKLSQNGAYAQGIDCPFPYRPEDIGTYKT